MKIADEQFLYLTTVGRKTGNPREIEIWFVIHERKFYVLAEYPTSNWVKNIRQNPDIRVRVGSLKFSGAGRVLDETRDGELFNEIQRLSREKYKWGEGLPVELAPSGPLSDKQLL